MSFSLIKYLIACVVIVLVLAIHPGNAQASPLNIEDCIKALPPGYTEPLFSGLGNHKYPTLTNGLKSKKAKNYFNQGMTLLYAFNHPEAIHSFNQAAKYEPEAAMLYWGIAMAAGPDINVGTTDACLNLADKAVQRAIRNAEYKLTSISSSPELDYAKALFTETMWTYGQALKYLDTARHVTMEDALAKLEEYWEEVGQPDPELKYGNNDASKLFRIANLVLVARTLEALPSNESNNFNNFIEKVKNRLENYPVLNQDSGSFNGNTCNEQIIDIWKRAVYLQDGLNYNEPSDWYYPLRESLGAAYYRQEKFGEAKAVFTQDLQIHKMNGRSLFGLIESLKKQGKEVPPELKSESDRSIGIFFQEIAALYEAFWSGKESGLVELPIQYKEYPLYQRQQLQRPNVHTKRSYVFGLI